MIQTNFRKMNFHAHTWRCKHAEGSVADSCAAAAAAGLTKFGISDHMPFPDDAFHLSVRMAWCELDEYLAEFASAREQFKDKLELFAGLEADYRPELGAAFYREEFREKRHFDYLIGGIHFLAPESPATSLWSLDNTFDAATVRIYANLIIEAIETGLFDFIAHPDLWARKTPEWTPEIRAVSRDLIAAATAHQVPLEINTYGLRRGMTKFGDPPRYQYPWRPFWELAGELGATAVIGTDAHKIADVAAGLDWATEFAASCGVKLVTPDFAVRGSRQ